MEKMYAQALYRAILGGLDPKEAMSRLVEVLKKHGHSRLLPRIARSLSQMRQRMSASEPTLTVARVKDADAALAQASALLKEQGVAPETVMVREDDSLIGGWIFSHRSTRTDASYKNNLLALYRAVTK